MIKIIKYSLKDLIKSKWIYFYTLFFTLFTISLFFLNNNINAISTNLMLLVIYTTPLIAIIFGTIYFYNSREFILLLLGQPIKRYSILFGLYFSFNLSLILSFSVGIFFPLILFGSLSFYILTKFIILILLNIFLTLIFSGISLLISTLIDNKIKGFGITLSLWLLMTIIYDSMILLVIFYFNDYPLENFILATTMFNPIDLTRILATIQSDSALLMGYTGALFSNFFGRNLGMFITIIILLLWIIIPLSLSIKFFNSKDF